MPVDAAGNRADMIMGSDSSIDRMNPGRNFEQFGNAAARDFVCDLKKRYGLPTKDANRIFAASADVVDSIFGELYGFYSTLSSYMRDHMATYTTDEKREHIYCVFSEGIPGVREDGLTLYMPQENDIEIVDAIAKIYDNYPVVYGPVTYKGFSGEKVVTKEPVMIGSLYIIMLEKTGDDWSACDSGLRQQFGVISLLPPNMRHCLPYRGQSVRTIGEAESRTYVSYGGPEITADLLDRSGNVDSHMSICNNILAADKPTNIDKVIDRREYVLGNNRSLQIVKHLAYVGGWRMRFDRANPYNAVGDITEESAKLARNIC
jgi:hypothetical protein